MRTFSFLWLAILCACGTTAADDTAVDAATDHATSGDASGDSGGRDGASNDGAMNGDGAMGGDAGDMDANMSGDALPGQCNPADPTSCPSPKICCQEPTHMPMMPTAYLCETPMMGMCPLLP